MSFKVSVQISCYDSIPSVIFYLLKLRDGHYENINDDTKLGLNLSIILNSACFIEGALESALKKVVEKRSFKKKYDDPFIYELITELESRIQRTTGIANYGIIFRTIFGTSIKEVGDLASLWEGLSILFQLRNLIAHGRPLSTTTNTLELDISNYLEESKFDLLLNTELRHGSFGQIREYLIKNNIIQKRFSKNTGDSEYVNNKVADHFWYISLMFLYKLCNHIPRGDRTSFKDGIGYNFIKIWVKKFDFV